MVYLKIYFQNTSIWYLLKPSWKLRGEFNLGGVLISQRKIIWNRGRKFQILKMLLAILFIYLDYLQKTLKRFSQKNLQKQNMWCKSGPKLQSYQYHSYALRITFILVAYEHLTNCKLVIILYFMFALVCVGVNHQKGGDWKGNDLKPFLLFWCLMTITTIRTN